MTHLSETGDITVDEQQHRDASVFESGGPPGNATEIAGGGRRRQRTDELRPGGAACNADAMETWELIVRESVRDVITRYNSNGDSGRFDAVMQLFADDAVMEFHGHGHRGTEEIRTIFTLARQRLAP